MNDAEDNRQEDRLRHVWQRLEQRHRTVLEDRLAGDTLSKVGAKLGVTRERVRQLQLSAESAFTQAAEEQLPDVRKQVLAALGTGTATPAEALERRLRTSSTVALAALLRALGIVNPRTWAGELAGWWTTRRDALDVQLRALAAQAPFNTTELEERARAIGLADNLPLHDLLSCAQSPLILVPTTGWVRRSTIATDSALLWLTSENAPRPTDTIAEAIGWRSKLALREALQRDDRFAQIRPDATWALCDWKTVEDPWPYRSAFEAIVDVLRELGPLTLAQLHDETIRRYPVSRSWITQCLSSHRVGRTVEGMYDLIERGALVIEDAEPRRPDNVTEARSGTIIIRLRVDSELLRGSSITVSRWLAWRLGLRRPASEEHFRLRGPSGAVAVRRNTGTTTVSSLRAAAHSLGLVSGCRILVALRPDEKTAQIRHGCTGGQCPARRSVNGELDGRMVATGAVIPKR